jgi:hypothetical protein
MRTIRDKCIQTDLNLFLCASFDGNGQVMSRFRGVGADGNGFNLNGITGRALSKITSAKGDVNATERLTAATPVPICGGVNRTILINDWFLERKWICVRGNE